MSASRERLIRPPLALRRAFVWARWPQVGGVFLGGGFALMVAIGTLVLLTPAASVQDTSVADAFFTTVSAVTLTGLVVVDTQTHWTLLGEGAVLALIFAGGLVYLVGASVVLWLLGRRLGLRDPEMRRLYRGAPGGAELLAFARTVVVVALVAQVLGTAALFLALLGADVSAQHALWWAPFHAISAFNNAGFALPEGGYGAFADDLPVLALTGVLSFLGGVGPIPIALLAARRSFRRLPLDGRVVVLAMVAVIAVGAGALLAGEWTNDATLGAAPAWRRPFLAVFEVAMRTTGLTTLDTAALRDESKVLATGLMSVGGAAGSVAGGVKVGVLAVLGAGLLATLRGRERLTLLGRELSAEVFRQAFTITLFFGVAVTLLAVGMIATADVRAIDALFESVSALSLSGWSAGLSEAAGTPERTLLLGAMVVGRFAPLLLVLEMTRQRRRPPYVHPEDSIRFG